MFVRDCVGDDDDLTTPVSGADADAELRFRVNRDVIVLNDIIGGAAWMASDELQQVDNWNDITPPEGETEENDEETTEETVETTLPERTEVNTPPISVDDDFGVRPGRTTVLPVLDNDTDADGDVLTVTVPGDGPSLGEVESINQGAGLQIAVPENASGSTLVHVPGRRRPRRQGHRERAADRARLERQLGAEAEARHGARHRVGRRRHLQRAPRLDRPRRRRRLPQGGRARRRRRGGLHRRRSHHLSRARPAPRGARTWPSSSRTATRTPRAIVRFDVRPPGSTDPVTNADHVQVRAGQSVTVAPLTNDTSGGSEPLRLARVDEVSGAIVRADFAANTFTFTSDAVGVYYVQYLAAVGSRMAPGRGARRRARGDRQRPPARRRARRRSAPERRRGARERARQRLRPGRRHPRHPVRLGRSRQRHLGLGARPRDAAHQRSGLARRSRSRSATRSRTARSSADGEVVVIPVPSPVEAAPAGGQRRPGGRPRRRRRDDPGARQRLPPQRRHDARRPRPRRAAPRPRGRRDLRLAGHRAIPRGPRGRHGVRHLRGRRQHRAEGCRVHHDPGPPGQRRDQPGAASARHHRPRAQRLAGAHPRAARRHRRGRRLRRARRHRLRARARAA